MSSAMSLSASDSGTPSSSAWSCAATNDFSDSDLLRSRRARNASRRFAPSSIWRSTVSISSAHRPAERLRHAPQREPVAEAGAHADGEDVEEVRQVALDRLLAQPPGAREPDVRARTSR